MPDQLGDNVGSMSSAHPDSDRFHELLLRARDGDGAALQDAFGVVFAELRGMASSLLARERVGHTLQTTALVNEAYLKLCKQQTVGVAERGQFLAIAAQAMRRILVDHARTRKRQKRGGNGERVGLDEAVLDYENHVGDLLDLDNALERLAEQDPRMSQVVELRFFAGLDAAETAAALDIGQRTCERDWTMARAWLRRQLAPYA